MKEYKGIKIIRKKVKLSNPKVNGSYSKIRNRITLYDRFFELSDDVQTSILEHEYSHYIWHKLPKILQDIWERVSVGDERILNRTKYKENAYVTEYAKSKVTEDWAECIETKRLLDNVYKGKKFGTYADFKMLVAKKIYDYYCKKENNG